MFNLPKCKSCKFYEKCTTNFSNGVQVSHACNSPKWQWTDEDREEINQDGFKIKFNFPDFKTSRHCEYKKNPLYVEEISELNIIGTESERADVAVEHKINEIISVVNLLVERGNNN